MRSDYQRVFEFVSQLNNMPCWHIGASESTGASFSLSLGGKWRRPSPKTPKFLDARRMYSGEADLMVWCTWRLDNQDHPIVSSDADSKTVIRELACLKDRKVVAVDVKAPAWDLTLEFTDHVRLSIFCDHLPPAPSFDGNWELSIADEVLVVGAGSNILFEPRTLI